MTQSTSLRALLAKDRNFRWLLGGAIVSAMGDQFSLIALPWLVLQVSGDTLALGVVLATMSIPRALFVLLGGALVDRHSARRVLLIAQGANMLLLFGLAGLVLSGMLQLWMIYVFALGIGVSTAFSIPSGSAIVPQVVASADLPVANRAMMGVMQLSLFVGPSLAGVLIALFSDGASAGAGQTRGIGLAFLFDGASFALSVLALTRLAMGARSSDRPPQRASMIQTIAEGVRYVVRDGKLATSFVYGSAIAFCASGPIQVAMPVLAGQLTQGASAFGILVGAFGAGSILGTIVSGARPNFRAGNVGRTMLLIDFIIGALFMGFGQINALWQGAAILLGCGTLFGYLQSIVYNWTQQRVQPQMLGRVMSVIMFMMMVITPLSTAVSGALLRSVAPGTLFAASGALVIVIVLIAMLATSMPTLSDLSAEPPAGEPQA
ncbi:major facilitator superfamily MFS_1 [Janthinobacterium sp. HH01]|uniref:MFS transporter n=1 Tax=Janthinobacterium sp. HH01 TaxID=1198452 RepID=UPI0002AEC8AC|nr:MFS transporter [Janthinobacterium sp. HH01]ELX08667.1 major facilitator superfamily MFS_1 [Janthinobacterium sp. HH01]